MTGSSFLFLSGLGTFSSAKLEKPGTLFLTLFLCRFGKPRFILNIPCLTARVSFLLSQLFAEHENQQAALPPCSRIRNGPELAGWRLASLFVSLYLQKIFARLEKVLNVQYKYMAEAAVVVKKRFSCLHRRACAKFRRKKFHSCRSDH